MSISLMMMASYAHADFALNFQPGNSANLISGQNIISCNQGSATIASTCAQGGFPGAELTPFYIEAILDTNTDIGYWHTIIGDPSTGFAQESYIAFAMCCWSNGQYGSSSSGDFNGGFTSGEGPLDPTSPSGTATGNPTRVEVRQVLSDAEISQEFLRSSLTLKRQITQALTTADLVGQFVANMGTLNYSTNSTPGTFTSTLTFTDPTYTANFYMATDAQTTFVTAGRYTYTSGTGYGGSAGTYTYVDGGFNPAAIDRNVYYVLSQDTAWSYPAKQP